MLQLALAAPDGILSWNTWPTTAEESGMPPCGAPLSAGQSGRAAEGPWPTEDAAAWSSDSTEDCMEASSSTDIISTTVSSRSEAAPGNAANRSPISRGIVLHSRSPLLPASSQFTPWSLSCIATGLQGVQPASRSNLGGSAHRSQADDMLVGQASYSLARLADAARCLCCPL